MPFSIHSFWKEKFSQCSAPLGHAELAGWMTTVTPVPAFVEPILTIRSGFENPESRLWLIAAPGAVGKSTLARQLAAELKLVLLDLSKASTIGGNYLSGGLVHTKLISQFEAGTLGIVIDALDEALLRVNAAGFEDFIADLARVSTERGPPIILLGREGVIDDAWTRFMNHGIAAPIVDIMRFNKAKAIEFVYSRLKERTHSDLAARRRLEQFSSIYERRAEELIDKLASAAGDSPTSGPMSFAGYAPVLQAVAEYVGGLENPHSAAGDIGVGSTLIEGIIGQILERESGKIKENLSLKHASVAKVDLYRPAEQRARLLSMLTGSAFDVPMPTLPPQIARDYELAIEQLLPQHPFLDGTGRTTSSAVFESDLLCSQLLEHSSSKATMAWAGHSKPGNPFLIDMYKQRTANSQSDAIIPPEHLGFLFASVQALAESGEEASFSFEESDAEDAAVVEMELYRQQNEAGAGKVWNFRSSTAGKITFLGTIGNVSVLGPVDIAIGDSQSGARVTAPTDFECEKLEIRGIELAVAAGAVPLQADKVSELVAVSFVAQTLDADALTRISLFGKVGLLVEFPNSRRHPWAPYATQAKPPRSAEIGNARLALRRLVVSFRSHSKGRLARYHKKIEHRRMTKGELGTLVREALLKENVLSLENQFYFLDADALGRVVKANYADIFQKRFSDDVDNWLEDKVLRQ